MEGCLASDGWSGLPFHSFRRSIKNTCAKLSVFAAVIAQLPNSYAT